MHEWAFTEQLFTFVSSSASSPPAALCSLALPDRCLLKGLTLRTITPMAASCWHLPGNNSKRCSYADCLEVLTVKNASNARSLVRAATHGQPTGSHLFQQAVHCLDSLSLSKRQSFCNSSGSFLFFNSSLKNLQVSWSSRGTLLKALS